MPYFYLQLRITAKVAQVVASKSMPQHILRPFLSIAPACLLPQFAPELLPICRAYCGGFPVVSVQDTPQRAVYRHSSRAACFAVPWMYIDGSLLQIHLFPGKPCHFVRAYTSVKHHPHRRCAASFRKGFCSSGDLLNLHRRQNRNGRFLHSWHLHLGYGITAAPASFHRCAEHSAEYQPCLLSLSRRVKCHFYIPCAFLRGDSTHSPFCQTWAALHEPPCEITEVIYRARSPVTSGIQCCFYRFCKAACLFLFFQFFHPCCKASLCSLYLSAVCSQCFPGYQRRVQYANPRASQYFYCRRFCI